MARKRVKRYDDGGEIVVTGQRENQVDMDTLDRLMRSRGGSGVGGGGGGVPSQRFTSTTMPVSKNNVRFGKIGTAAGPVYGAEYGGENFSIGAGLGKGLAGKQGAPMFGATGSLRFKKGGKVKKMAKGGSVSSASKRADGCATKGKTKGRFV
jgi:hypothetical protein